MKKKLLLFIPAYNCEKQIVRVLEQMDQEILNYVKEILVVNNRSTDHTEKEILQYKKEHVEIPLKVFRNTDNYGLGGSHKVAFQYAKEQKYDYVIVLHGDDQGDIHDILPLLKNGRYQKYDCCLGARFMKGASLKNYSAFRTFGNRVYNFLFSLIVGFKVYDLGSGLNLYRVSMLEEEFYKKYPDNLMFNYCMVMAIQYYKQKAMFFPISWREEDQVSNVKLFRQAKKVLGMLVAYACSHKKFMQKELRSQIVNVYSSEEIMD